MSKSIFGCEQIEQPKQIIIKHKNKFLPQSHILCSITGSSGCGKSTFLLGVIDGIFNVSQILICSLIIGNPVYDSIQKYCERKKIDYHFSSNPIEAQNTISELVEKKKKDTWGVIIYDDFNQGKVQSAGNPYTKCTCMSACMLRNYGYHMFFITQGPTNIPTTIRNNLNMRVVYKMNNRYDIISQQEDFNKCVNIPKRVFMKLYNQISKVQFSFLMLSGNKLYIYIKDDTEIPERIHYENYDDDE
jgi:hypothetical protein